MLRWIFLAILIVALAAMSTIAVQFLASPSADTRPAFPTDVKDQVGPLPKVVVDDDLIHDFGSMAQHAVGQWTWTIRNEGKGALTLRKIKTSCSCTIANLKSDRDTVDIEPGGSTTLTLEWKTRGNMGDYSQSADIGTNDPERPSLTFTTKGRITQSLVFLPEDRVIHFGNIPNDKPHEGKMAVYSPDAPDLEITSITSSRPEQVEAKARPLSAEERKDVKASIGKAYAIDVTVKPGMPLGAIGETLSIRTNHPKAPEVGATISGTVVGPIKAWPGSVQMTVTAGSKPASKMVTLWVNRGESIKIDVASAPKMLKVDLKEVDHKTKDSGEAVTSRTFRLTVTVPSNTPPMVIDDAIVLKTDLPNASEIRIPVAIMIINRG